MLIRCLSCHGRKSLIGLGNMLVKCKTCKGVGFIEDEPTDDDYEEEVEEPKKKMGRPPSKQPLIDKV